MSFHRKTYKETISQELPFYRIEDTLSGKNLLKARNLWRQGTNIVGDLALPWKFDIEELEGAVKEVPVQVKRDIFEYCGRGILLERRGVDADIAECLILDALFHYGEICDSYYAFIVEAFCCEFLFINSNLFGENVDENAKKKFLQDAESAYLKAIQKSSDPRAYAMYSNLAFLVECRNENKGSHDPGKVFEKSISELGLTLSAFAGLERNVSKHRLQEYRNEWRESFSVFDVHFTYASLLHNKISVLYRTQEEGHNHLQETKTSEGYEPIDRELILELQHEKRNHLKKYLDAAPICHWNVPTACYMLSVEWISRKAPATGANPKELYIRNVDDVENSIKLYKKAMVSKKILNKWLPSSFTNAGEENFYKVAHQLQEMFQAHGYIDSIPSLPEPEPEETVEKVTNLYNSENENGDEGYADKFRGLLTQENHVNVQFVYLFILTALIAEPILTYLGIVS
uniref:Uncharacterized protein n=1 Tax=Aplanochytrium stocchinoi TaxID=215587 RepID=A0A7S3LLN0_9STRA